MATWPTRPESGDPSSYGSVNDPLYANLPTSPTTPTTMDPLHPPVRSPINSSNSSSAAAGRASYISSPLNPGAPASTARPGPIPRSRPVSWGAAGALDKMLPAGGDDGSSGSGSGGHGAGDRGTLKGIVAGTVGGDYGPYAPLRASLPHNRFSTMSSAASFVSLPTDSKYPSMYLPNSDTRLSGAFFPYSDSPHIDYATNSFTPDEDDDLHNPDPRGYKDSMAPLNWRGVFNLFFVFLIIAALVTLFAGYPIISYVVEGDNLYGNGIGVNGSGQAAFIPNLPQLIDVDTPDEAKTRTGIDGFEYELVFSDEFNVDGRTFYEGEDPFWEAVDLNYWATADMEWYDPSMITTRDGSLVITLDQIPNHKLWYKSGMLQSWNKFCFTGGYVEVSTLFPGNQLGSGYWPAAWTMGNLGRPGYGATTDGTWPYTYDACDVGTLPNQTRPDLTPALAQTSGNKKSNGVLSYLPGQRLSACTCPGEDHPGPSNDKGRAAPEIDVFEAERSKIGGPGGQTSQSSQYAPFAASYNYDLAATTNWSPERTHYNTFHGSATQQSISTLTDMDENWFEGGPNPTYAVYGVEFGPNPDDRASGYINWVAGGEKTATVTGGAIGPDPSVEISQRMISEEPMSLILNLGISPSFQPVIPTTLSFPATLRFDYIRVYQRKGHVNVGCDPASHPTAKYINEHLEAYTNVNLTSWAQAGYSFPKSSLKEGC